MSEKQLPVGDQEPDEDTSSDKTSPLQEGVDYYIENGLMVFTGTFLEKRGFCCESGCRHCPYGFKPNHLKRTP
ncbi:MAG: DUF5522 domain-containing protein [Pyrinomonadaceae bacterium]